MTDKEKQCMLYLLGCYRGEIDGLLGPVSREAIRAFQQSQGLEPDGDFGPKTQAAALAALAAGTGLSARGPEGKNPDSQSGAEAGTSPGGQAGGTAPGVHAGAGSGSAAAPGFWGSVEYFRREEFRCRCGGKYCNGFPAEPSEKLVRMLDRARVHFGVPGRVESGVRCEVHNAKVGGVATSRHRKGWAADIFFDGKSPEELERWFKADPDCAYCYRIVIGGRPCGDVHVDVVE